MSMGLFILKNAVRNPRRTFLTAMSLAISLAMIVILQTILLEITNPQGLNEAVPRLVVRHRTSLTLDLPLSYGEKLRKIDGVAAVTPMQWFGGVWKSDDFENFFPRFGIDPSNFFDVFPDYPPLKPEYLEALRTERTACLVGDKIRDRYGFKIGDRIVIKGDIFPVDLEFTVRGFFTGPQADWLLFNFKYLEESMPDPIGTGTFFMLAKDQEQVPAILSAAEEMFRNSDAQVKAETEKAFQLSFVEMLGNIQLLIGTLISVVVFAVLLIAASTMAMAIRERTREIAVLKTLGFTRGQVMTLVIAEGLLISAGGGLLGIAGTALVVPNARLLLAVIAAMGVTVVVGLTLLLVAVLLPEKPMAEEGDRSLLMRVQAVVARWGPRLALGLGGATLVAMLILLPQMDWFKLTGGMIPSMNVRESTLRMATLIAIAVGYASSLLPSWTASRVSVLDGLRSVG